MGSESGGQPDGIFVKYYGFSDAGREATADEAKFHESIMESLEQYYDVFSGCYQAGMGLGIGESRSYDWDKQGIISRTPEQISDSNGFYLLRYNDKVRVYDRNEQPLWEISLKSDFARKSGLKTVTPLEDTELSVRVISTAGKDRSPIDPVFKFKYNSDPRVRNNHPFAKAEIHTCDSYEKERFTVTSDGQIDNTKGSVRSLNRWLQNGLKPAKKNDIAGVFTIDGTYKVLGTTRLYWDTEEGKERIGLVGAGIACGVGGFALVKYLLDQEVGKPIKDSVFAQDSGCQETTVINLGDRTRSEVLDRLEKAGLSEFTEFYFSIRNLSQKYGVLIFADVYNLLDRAVNTTPGSELDNSVTEFSRGWTEKRDEKAIQMAASQAIDKLEISKVDQKEEADIRFVLKQFAQLLPLYTIVAPPKLIVDTESSAANMTPEAVHMYHLEPDLGNVPDWWYTLSHEDGHMLDMGRLDTAVINKVKHLLTKQDLSFYMTAYTNCIDQIAYHWSQADFAEWTSPGENGMMPLLHPVGDKIEDTIEKWASKVEEWARQLKIDSTQAYENFLTDYVPADKRDMLDRYYEISWKYNHIVWNVMNLNFKPGEKPDFYWRIRAEVMEEVLGEIGHLLVGPVYGPGEDISDNRHLAYNFIYTQAATLEAARMKLVNAEGMVLDPVGEIGRLGKDIQAHHQTEEILNGKDDFYAEHEGLSEVGAKYLGQIVLKTETRSKSDNSKKEGEVYSFVQLPPRADAQGYAILVIKKDLYTISPGLHNLIADGEYIIFGNDQYPQELEKILGNKSSANNEATAREVIKTAKLKWLKTDYDSLTTYGTDHTQFVFYNVHGTPVILYDAQGKYDRVSYPAARYWQNSKFDDLLIPDQSGMAPTFIHHNHAYMPETNVKFVVFHTPDGYKTMAFADPFCRRFEPISLRFIDLDENSGKVTVTDGSDLEFRVDLTPAQMIQFKQFRYGSDDTDSIFYINRQLNDRTMEWQYVLTFRMGIENDIVGQLAIPEPEIILPDKKH